MSWLGVVERRKTAIGLDLGATGTRCVQLQREGSTWRVADWLEHETRAESVFDLGVENGLRRHLKSAEFSGRRCACGLSSPDVESHSIELPKLAPDKRVDPKEIIQFEIRRISAMDAAELQVAYWTLPAAKGRTAGAIGVAAMRSRILRLLNRVKEQGLECDRVDLSACGLVRFLHLLRESSSSAIEGILDLGDRQTRLILCVDRIPVLARSVGEGGAAWTRRLAEALKISPEAAEVHKRDHGIVAKRKGTRQDAARGAFSAELAVIQFGVLRDVLQKLVREITKSYSYVLSGYAERKPGELLLTGGGARMPHLDEFLGEHLGLGIAHAQDWAAERSSRLSVGNEVGSRLHRLAAAIGLVSGAEEVTP